MLTHKTRHIHWLWALCLGPLACSGTDADTDETTSGSDEVSVRNPSAEDLEQRAYIVSRDAEELTVIDLKKLEIIGRVPTGGGSNHMAELNGDFTKAYVTSSATDEAIIVDT